MTKLLKFIGITLNRIRLQGRGFNSGVMLLDLAKLRNMSWSHIWEETAAKIVKKYGPAELADQASRTIGYIALLSYFSLTFLVSN